MTRDPAGGSSKNETAMTERVRGIAAPREGRLPTASRPALRAAHVHSGAVY